MHILLTRPLDDCKELILRFKSLGHKVSHLPVIKIQNVNYDKININEFGGIIFTSANAIKNLNTSDINKKINCYCVGSSTENVAKHKVMLAAMSLEIPSLNLVDAFNIFFEAMSPRTPVNKNAKS